MTDEPRSNRPTPRTPAGIEAELRHRIRAELTQARSDADGELDDATLASVIARAITAAMGWHLEAPEHTRNATLSSKTWKPAAGPRGARPPRDFEADAGAERGPARFEDRGPRFEDRGPRFEDRGPPRRFDDRRRPFPYRPAFQDRPPREFDREQAPPRNRPGFNRDEVDPRGPRPPGPGWRQGPNPRGGGGGRPTGGRPSGGRPSGGRGGGGGSTGGGGFGPRRPPRGR